MSGSSPTGPSCYECQYQGHAPASHHSQCEHPKLAGKNIIEKLECAVDLGITGNPHGIDHGWFFWPLDFDPVWLQSCNGFAAKEAPVAEAAS